MACVCRCRVIAAGVPAASGTHPRDDDIIAVSAEKDLLVAEAYMFEREVPHHLAYRTLEARQEDLSAKRIVVTHMSDDVLSRLDLLCPRYEPAYDGMRIRI